MEQILLLILILFINLSICSEDEKKYLIACINEIAKRCFGNKTVYSIDNNEVFNFPIVRYNVNKYFKTFFWKKPDAYIIYVGANNFGKTLRELDSEPYFNPNANFLIIASNTTKNVVNELRNHYMFKTVIIDKFDLNLYTANIESQSLKNIGQCSQKLDLNGMFGGTANYSYWKRRKIKVLYLQKPPYTIDPKQITGKGLEFTIFDIISSHLRLYTLYVPSNYTFWGTKVNGVYSHLWGELKNGTADVVMGSCHAKFEESLDFDASFAYMEDAFHFVVPKAGIIESWKRLGLPFTITVWNWLGFTFFVVTITWYCMNKIIQENRYFNSLPNIVLLLQNLLLEGMSHINVKTITFKLLFSLWLLFSIICSTAFKCKLTYFLTGVNYEHQINSLQEIVDSDLKIGMDLNLMKNLFGNENDERDRYIIENCENCLVNWDCTSRVAFQKDFVTVKIRRQLKYVSPRMFLSPDGKALLHMTESSINSFLIQLFFVKGHPLLPMINKYLMILKETGFVQYTYDLIDDLNRKALTLAMKENKEFNVSAVKLKQLELVFILYCLSILLSCIVFVLEITKYNFK